MSDRSGSGISRTTRSSTSSAVLVHSEEKVGKDAGEIAGIDPIGVVATDDVESIIAIDADCVFYTPIIMDVDTVCRLLRSGKNVVTTSGFFHPSPDFRDDGERDPRSLPGRRDVLPRRRHPPGLCGRHPAAHAGPRDEQRSTRSGLRGRQRADRCAAGPHRLAGLRQGQGQVPLRANDSRASA